MTKAYVEPNIINWSRRVSWSGVELRRRLAERGLEPHFGLHGIYELARGLLSEASHADARSNFAILGELDPVIGPTPDMLYEREVERLRTGADVLPVLDNLNRTSAKQQILQMAAGHLESAGRELIEAREASIPHKYPSYSANIVSRLASAIAGGMARAATFEEACAQFGPHVPGIIRQILGGRISPQEAQRLHERLGEIPCTENDGAGELVYLGCPNDEWRPRGVQ